MGYAGEAIWNKILQIIWNKILEVWSSKNVITREAIWNKILEKNPYARAYYYQHEPLFNKIAMLFGIDDVKLEHSSTMIIISETIVKLVSGDVDVDEEVNSPAIFPPHNVKHKLFFEEGGASDQESTNQPPNRVVDAGSEGVTVNSVENSKLNAKKIGSGSS
ncbi:hypothetical protein AAHA92_15280 [Salvia divinorum]|uniref:Uncharacterized protein n=1 Tax=Salvia divinorum TaxID=28513 RepID=A0ABD1HED4_SALDI